MDELILETLRGCPGRGLEPCFGELFGRATWHRVDLLLADTVLRQALLQSEDLVARLRARLRAAAVSDLATTARVGRLTAAIAEAGCGGLLVKGAAIGPMLYSAPHLRPRLDTDLLINPNDCDAVKRVLEREGFEAAPEALGPIGTGQSHWLSRSDTVAVDLHWRLFNAQPFARVLTFEELWASSEPSSSMPGAQVPSLDHQLLIAAVHRVAHHYDSPRLIWLYDLHLLATALGPERLDAAIATAEARGIGAVLARGLLRAADAFGTAFTDDVRERLLRLEPDRHKRVYLEGAPRLVDLLEADLAAQCDWPARFRLVREHLFPPAAYMRSVYSRWPWPLLPLAYVHRIARGAPKWFRRASGRP